MSRPTWIAEVDGQAVGFTDLTADGLLDMMFVHPQFQGRGIASRLLQEVEADGPCAAVLGDGAPAAAPRLESVEVYGTNAIARFDSDTVFLARFRDGWRVTAAHCRPTWRLPMRMWPT